jgi:hypothetical protein
MEGTNWMAALALAGPWSWALVLAGGFSSW